MARERPVTDKEFKEVLRILGFTPQPKKGTSHEQWVKDEGSSYKRVTVDPHHAPYHRQLLKLMLSQAGITKDQFFKLLK
ncbi:type II toxin-antitoxin system HicA family toxin [Xanthomonas translucens]|uniref:Type II toxin-antitoxin system HicA family toxin n=1 Tax=Xanthomonas translucens pv. translucens TaxID=134875 RepID=A0ABW9KRX3_XANCT|nr:type II toxin-antitoxin system HicA family toxin [Xanthomonas translucens pv. translucens]